MGHESWSAEDKKSTTEGTMRTLRLAAAAALILIVAVVGPALATRPGGPGLYTTTLYAGKLIDAGQVDVWNSPSQVHAAGQSGRRLDALGCRIYGWAIQRSTRYRPPRRGNPIPGKFPYTKGLRHPRSQPHLRSRSR